MLCSLESNPVCPALCRRSPDFDSASGDDNNPVLKLWDLRSSTTVPLATLAGHTEGILSVAWCPFGEEKRGEHGVWKEFFCGRGGGRGRRRSSIAWMRFFVKHAPS